MLGWNEYGDPRGRPVLAFHGTPASRLLFEPAAGPAGHRGLRLIAPDRPGYGMSVPHPGRTFADWTADVAHLLDHLGVGRVPLLAISGGCPYAVVCASGMPTRISGLALVSPLGDVGSGQAVGKLNRLDRAVFLGLPGAPHMLDTVATLGRAAFLHAPEMSISSFALTLSAEDRRILATPAHRQTIIAMTKEAIRYGVEGAVSDLALYGQPWDIDLARIAVPATIWQGTADTVVPPELAFDLADRLVHGHAVRLEGHGHFWVLENFALVVDAVAALAAGT